MAAGPQRWAHVALVGELGVGGEVFRLLDAGPESDYLSFGGHAFGTVADQLRAGDRAVEGRPFHEYFQAGRSGQNLTLLKLERFPGPHF